jgi:ADP-heptose:LPS heptosyltransferase
LTHKLNEEVVLATSDNKQNYDHSQLSRVPAYLTTGTKRHWRTTAFAHIPFLCSKKFLMKHSQELKTQVLNTQPQNPHQQTLWRHPLNPQGQTFVLNPLPGLSLKYSRFRPNSPFFDKNDWPDFSLMEEPIERILLGMDEGIGNMVMLTPTIHALAQLFPQAKIDVIGRRPALDVLEGWDLVNRLIDEKSQAEKKYDLVLLTAWNGTLRKPLKNIEYKYEPLVLSPIQHHIHEATQHFALARLLGFEGPVPKTYCAYGEYPLKTQQRTKVALADTSKPEKQWDKKRWSHYQDLAMELLNQGHDVILLGSKDDAKRYNQPWPEGVIDLQGKMTVLETASVMKQVDLVVSNDSGLAHMAAALEIPTLCLWGPTSLVKNKPLGPKVYIMNKVVPCSPCQNTPQWMSCQNNVCLSEISPQEVSHRIAELFLITGEKKHYQNYWNTRARMQGPQMVGHGSQNKELHNQTTAKISEALLPLLKNLNLKNPFILDFGCGWGRFTHLLQENLGGKALGVDMTEEILLHSTPNENVRFQACQPGAKLPVESESVDLLFTHTVLQHINNPQILASTISEFEWILKPQGKLLIFENTEDKEDLPHNSFRSIGDYKELFRWADLSPQTNLVVEAETHTALIGTKP